MSNSSQQVSSHIFVIPKRSSIPSCERVQGAYRSDENLPDTTMCPECHASVHEGRWQWLEAPAGSNAVLCPACRRVRDEYPAGFVSVEGDFFDKHRVELMHLVQTSANHAVAEHPLRRLMGADDTPEGVMFRTTDTHLAREIGDSLHKAYGGKLVFHYEEEEELLRVHWAK